MRIRDKVNWRSYEGLIARLKSVWGWPVRAVFRIRARRFSTYIGPREASQRWQLIRHPTDFSVINRRSELTRQVDDLPAFVGVQVRRLATGISRVSADPKQVDLLMDELRLQNVVHHIYQVADGTEEIAITDKIYLTLREHDSQTLDEICKKYKLIPTGRKMGSAHILQVTEDSAVNPLKIANMLTMRGDVKSCVPETLMPVTRSNAVVATLPDLNALATEHNKLRQQWNLNTGTNGLVPLAGPAGLSPSAGIRAHEAWVLVKEKFQKSDVVIAVIDDGFDFTHPALKKKTPDKNEFDFIENNASTAVTFDCHGTCVASIIAANADKMLGVAPGCELLPIRIAVDDSALLPEVLLKALTLASAHADVVNCSFNHIPERIDRLKLLHTAFGEEVGKLIADGGRLGNGLVIVFSAGNHDSPISLLAEDNKNGVRFKRQDPGIPAGKAVHTFYTEIPNIVVVGAMTSIKRKAGYSNWGEKLTVTAPSDNFHELKGLPGFGEDADYVGLDIVAAIGGPDPRYGNFGGTSAAAPIVTGVVALMRSVNSKLTPADIIEILQRTADRKNFPDQKLDIPNDPNVQGFGAEFDGAGRSIIFGAGKVDAAEAVRAAIPD